MSIKISDVLHWNFEADDTGIRVCRNEHERSEACQYELLTPVETLELIDLLKAACVFSSRLAVGALHVGGLQS